MGLEENQETTSFMPMMSRLDRLDRVLQLLEEKHSLSRRDFCANTCGATTMENNNSNSNKDDDNNKECKTISSALEEVQHKGTLVDRLTLLENRVLQLSLEMDEGNTSKSSSSTVQISEITGKDPPTFQHEEKANSADGIVRERKTQHKSRGQKKWLGMFRVLRC